ncbi:MAG: DUF1249 domain-containing protein [Pseudohongiellaceae bacterium]
MVKDNYRIDLIRQMAECDANYIRLLKLLPNLMAFREKLFDSVGEERLRTGSANRGDCPDSECEELLGDVMEFSIAGSGADANEISVTIKVVESFRYTTTLEITQQPDSQDYLMNPSLTVRVYHDASTAEVTSYQGHANLKPNYPQPNPQMYHRDEKVQVNRFLGEWLSLCLEAGRSMRVPNLIYST